MTISWLGLFAAVVLWPLPRPADMRLRRLAGSARLAPPRAAPRGLRWRPSAPSARGALLAAGCAGVAIGLVSGAAIGATAAIVLATVGLLGTRSIVRRAQHRRRRDLVAALRLLCAELDAGSAIDAALAAAAVTGSAHRAVFVAGAVAAAKGDDVSAALGSVDDPELHALVGCWRVTALTGAPLAAVIGRLAGDLAARLAQRREIDTALAGPRSSAALLSGLPALGVLLGAAMGARPLAVLFGTSAGRLLLCVGVALDALGVLWTARLVTSAERA